MLFVCVAVNCWYSAWAFCSAWIAPLFAVSCRRAVSIVLVVELAAVIIFDVYARFQWEKSVPIRGARSVGSTSTAY